MHLAKLQAVLASFLESLRSNRELVEFLDNVTAGNVRLALDLVRGFFGSGHVDTKKIVEIYEDTGSYTVPVHEFLRAVMFGDTEHYDPTRSPIANLFDISSLDPAEHFLLPLLVTTLANWTGAGIEDGFVETTRLYEQLQGHGFNPEQIELAIVRAHYHKLIESAARKMPVSGESIPTALRVTTVGVYHVTRLSHMFTYLDAVTVDLPILTGEVRDQIHDVRSIEGRLRRADLVRQYLDSQWYASQVRAASFDWPAASLDLAKEVERIRRRVSGG